MKAYQGRTNSSKDDWETPPELFEPLHKLYDFNLDAAANKDNTLCKYFLENALVNHWDLRNEHARVWCNPPFSQKEEFLDRALQYRQLLDYVFFLLPNNARETSWWNELVVPFADTIINLVGRVNFLDHGKPTNQCNFPSCLVVYRPRLINVTYVKPQELYWDWRNENV